MIEEFKVGDEVIVTTSGYGIGDNDVGKVLTITEISSDLCLNEQRLFAEPKVGNNVYGSPFGAQSVKLYKRTNAPLNKEDENKIRERKLIQGYEAQLAREKEKNEKRIVEEQEIRRNLIPNTIELKKNKMGIIRKSIENKYGIYWSDYLNITHYTLQQQAYPLPKEKEVINYPMIYVAYYDFSGNFCDFGTLTRSMRPLKTPHTSEGHMCIGDLKVNYENLKTKEITKIREELMRVKDLLTVINPSSPLNTPTEINVPKIKEAANYASSEYIRHNSELNAEERNRRRQANAHEYICYRCDNLFEHALIITHGHTFCCEDCESDWYNENTTSCTNCADTIYLDNVYESEFCCRDCFDQYYDTHKRCETCETMRTTDSMYNDEDGMLYCNKECASKAHDELKADNTEVKSDLTPLKVWNIEEERKEMTPEQKEFVNKTVEIMKGEKPSIILNDKGD